MSRAAAAFALGFVAFASVCVAAPSSPPQSRGPGGGLLVAVGDQGHQVEVIVTAGTLLELRVLGKDLAPIAIDAEHITLTFVEKDGEKEDYKIRALRSSDGKRVFGRKSGHVIDHIMRDKMSVTVSINDQELASTVFRFPYGPNGGKLLALGDAGVLAELVVEGDFVRVHVLDGKKSPKRVSASEITLTFTEPDGETEDYGISVKQTDAAGSVYEEEDDHIVKHVLRDKMSIQVVVDGKPLKSTTFAYKQG